jgi:hypothetical protein
MWQLDSHMDLQDGNEIWDDTNYAAEEMSEKGLTDFFAEQQKRRGRRSELSDPQLNNRREQFIQIFEGSWGEIGSALPKCKRADDLALIFRPLAESRSWIAQVVEIFCRPSSESFSASALRQVRSGMRRLVEPVRLGDELTRFAKERLNRLDGALAQAHGRDRRIVKRARKQRRKELWKALVKHGKLADSEKSLKARLKSLEGSFAREELMRFIKSKRYEIKPLSLANAVAGIPYMGWRQSMRRNASTQPVTQNGPSYQAFKAIRYLVESQNRKTKTDLVKSFRESIQLLPSRFKLSQAEFSKNWLYLERAIRKSFRMKPSRKGLPFEITRRYFEQIQTQSNLDIILADQAQIPLSKPKARGATGF